MTIEEAIKHCEEVAGEHEQKLKPKAWMPLPEQYKAESEE